VSFLGEIGRVVGCRAPCVARCEASVAGDLSSDVEDAVAQPLGFCAGVFAVEGQRLCPDEDVVGCQREREPCRVCLAGLEWEMPGAAA
jgi:hypothetical protein